MPRASTPPAARRAALQLVQHIVAGWRCQAIHSAVQLGLPEHLQAKPLGASALATATGADPDGLNRLLRALCTLGVCSQHRNGRFALTTMGRLLLPDAADGVSLRALAQWWGGPLWPMWGELTYSVQTGRSARQKLSGETAYAVLERGAETARTFHDAQRGLTSLVLDDLVSWAGWRGLHKVVDVGGGHGQVALALLAAHSGMAATVFDLPHAEAGAQQRTAAAGLEARCCFQTGSFFDDVPAGADAYVLKSILHNWDDTHAADILRACRRAARPDARLVLVERVYAERLSPNVRDAAAARTDLNMLAGLGGRERTQAEYAKLLDAAGFMLTEVLPLGFEFSLLAAQARPAA